MTHLTLSFGPNELRLVPEAGGGIAEFLSNGAPVLRSALPGAIEARDPLGLASFPMTPFVNRIRNGQFTFGGRKVQIEQPTVRHPLHGQGWRRPWRIADLGASRAVLEFDGGGDDWPWRYRSRQTFELSGTTLEVQLDIENLDETPMPASLGLHPYFPGLARASLKARASGMWETDRELIPTQWVGAGTRAFEDFSPLAGSDLDACFTGFTGEAAIRWTDRSIVRVIAQGCSFMQVYTRGADGSFCVEAQTAMPDALNRTGDPLSGISILDPGKTFGCTTCFVVESPAPGPQ